MTNDWGWDSVPFKVLIGCYAIVIATPILLLGFALGYALGKGWIRL